MSAAYGIISLVALILVGVCFAVDKNRNILLLLLFVSVFICELGYFLISIANNLDFALNANRLAYLGSVFLPFFLFFMILNLCDIKYKPWLTGALCVVGVIVLLIAASPGIFTIYYKEVSLISVDGVSRLIREYGPLHIVYYIYIFAYLAAMLISVIYAIVKKKITSALQVTFLFAAVLCNIIIWFAEQLLPRGFELLAVSYVMTEIFILLLYAIMQEYGRLGHVETATGEGEPGGRYLLSDRKRTRQDRTDRDGHFFDAEDIEKIVANCEADFALTARETDVLRCILANKKRKDIAAELFVTESTIKKYTSSIFKKMAVDNRISLLLEAQKYL